MMKGLPYWSFLLADCNSSNELPLCTKVFIILVMSSGKLICNLLLYCLMTSSTWFQVRYVHNVKVVFQSVWYLTLTFTITLYIICIKSLYVGSGTSMWLSHFQFWWHLNITTIYPYFYPSSSIWHVFKLKRMNIARTLLLLFVISVHEVSPSIKFMTFSSPPTVVWYMPTTVY